MRNLYLTADKIGTPSGGGAVTFNELEALKGLGDVEVWSQDQMSHASGEEPWKWDAFFSRSVASLAWLEPPKLAHGYAGTFSKSICRLKEMGTKVCWTVAAHDLEASIDEHVKVYGEYPFKHMSDPASFERYKRGYLEADVLICPSNYSADVMRRYGRMGRIEVIPHGVNLPSEVRPLPNRFIVGYLGAMGPDKGVIYLLQAWKKLALKDSILMLGGKDTSRSEFQIWARYHGGGNIWFAGWLENVSDFYNSISVYVQPSVTEGFGIEVLEAMAYGRPVICSCGAGASELLPVGWRVGIRNVDELIHKIGEFKREQSGFLEARVSAEQHTWDKIRVRYQNVWKEMLNESA